ncbi:bacterio-opsin activator domain-containing protein [Halogeometricum limi]|uniref:PAS domain S-box-containing protein n=1 Tax=Halogeometricum limi TaxID=555875 RepID=A0A1I6H924_9EURY|nr:bacterio-opsin activator domain-containing protein [Halogeometricum limi]SFR50814.1 PAS domain S-box-containing protein [Halogeometricum limi]
MAGLSDAAATTGEPTPNGDNVMASHAGVLRVTDSYTVWVVGTLPERFDAEQFERASPAATFRWETDPQTASFDGIGCALATTTAVSTGAFDREDVSVPVVVLGDEKTDVAETALSVGASDYLTVQGTEAEATWLARRCQSAAESYRSERMRTRLDRHQRALSDLGAFSVSGPTREELFDETIRCLSEGLDAQRIGVFRARPERGDLSMVAADGWPDAYVGGVALGLDTNAGRALVERTTVAVDDLGAAASPLGFDGARSELSVVVSGSNHPWGVLSVYGSEPYAFDDADRRFVENVATLVAAVVERETLRTTLEEVFGRVDQGLVGLDDGWRVTYANPEAERLLSTESGELLGTSVWDLFEDADPFRDRLEHAARTGEKASFEAYYPPHDRWYEVEAYPSQAGLSVYLTDVTESAEREMELLRYERMVEAADDGVYALDADQQFVQVNAAFAEMFGRTQADLIGVHISELIDEEYVTESDRLRAEATETGESRRMEFPADLPGGETAWIEAQFSAIVDEETNRFVGTVGVVRDVSERRYRERSLTALHEWTREMAQATDTDSVVDQTIEGCHDLFDPCSAAFFGYDAVERTLESHERSDDVEYAAGAESEDDLRWIAFTDERTVLYESGDEHVYFAPVGQYGVLVVEQPPGETGRETDVEVLGLLAATMGELLTSVEANEALQERDQRLERQNDRLTKLNRINRTVRGVTRSVVRAATTEEAMARACERLVEAEPYRFAWLCEFDGGSADGEGATPTTTAGVDDGYAARLSAVAQTPPFPALLSRVASSGRRAVVDDVLNDPAWQPHRRDALSRGFRSLIVVPAGENRVLVVHGTRPEMFVGEDGDVLVELGETLGAAIDRLGRSRPMLGDQQTEVELVIRDDHHFLVRLAAATNETATVTGIVPTTEGEYRAFVRTVAPYEAAAAALPAGTVVRELTDEDDDEHLYEVRPPDTSLFDRLYTGRGRLHEMRADGEECTLSLTVPSDESVRSIVEAFAAVYSDTQLVARRTVSEPTESAVGFRARLDDAWTERQREAISSAFHGGLYDWPRKTSVSTLADAFDVSSPTFQYHLRVAERKLLERTLQ